MAGDHVTLVTGATGRLGKALLPLLGGRLRCLALPGDPGTEALRPLGVEVVYGRLETGEGLMDAAAGVSTVLHLAAQLPGEGVTDADLFGSIVLGTFNLLEAVVTAGAPQPRFVYVSSSAVYGPQLPALEMPITEEHPMRPTSVYGAAKVAGEAFVTSYSNSRGVRSTIVRPADIVVAADFVPPSGFMARRLDIDADRGVVGVEVDDEGGSNMLSFSSATDVARGLVAALAPEAIGGVFHIGPQVTISDADIAKVVARHRGLEVVERPGGGRRQWVLDSSKAKSVLGFEATDSLESVLGNREP